jgi:hypothetical protein
MRWKRARTPVTPTEGAVMQIRIAFIAAGIAASQLRASSTAEVE